MEDKELLLARLKERTSAEVLRILDAKVEVLWLLGEPKDKLKIPVQGNIPIISDIDKTVASEAVESIAIKYDIKKHDLYMLRRAFIMQIYHGLGRNCPLRLELAEELNSKILWQ